MFRALTAKAACSTSSSASLDNLINQKLVEQAAKEKGIKVSDADIQKQIDQLKGGFKDQAQFDAGAQERRHDRRRAQDVRSASSS